MNNEVVIPGPAELRGSWYPARAPRAVAVLHGATAVPHRFYRHFAKWLATEQSVSCLTYDYRDFGASTKGHIRHATASLADWGIADQQAARDWVSVRSKGLPIWVIGHSLGGLMLARQTRTEEISHIIAVCSGPVHTCDHPWPHQALVRALWFGIGPMSMAALGYVPGRLSGLGSDLPGPVFRQLKHWCTTRGFDLSEPDLPQPRPTGLACPLRTVGVSDDASVPPPVVSRLAERYPFCPHEHVVLKPEIFGLEKVGHTAIFSRRNAAMWPTVIGANPSVPFGSG
ncbi:alpha/beta fold hydrolase [Aliiroseovarius sp. KMU-50]|uniref:Alpha/beta fold hydrolase n=1 Tax=Aliiroseovarius salicola TaxID=3009082 RepID=A0ABT4VY75_9RHOB|nr:alpha/beta fold hydrolase [Aliiroseovarius sp. KMU-50]MDA5093204.1 alpha/beta fold hydrolase [Aliiroseovarius sp. KMU-50]